MALPAPKLSDARLAIQQKLEAVQIEMDKLLADEASAEEALTLGKPAVGDTHVNMQAREQVALSRKEAIRVAEYAQQQSDAAAAAAQQRKQEQQQQQQDDAAREYERGERPTQNDVPQPRSTHRGYKAVVNSSGVLSQSQLKKTRQPPAKQLWVKCSKVLAHRKKWDADDTDFRIYTAGAKGARVHQNAVCTAPWIPNDRYDTPTAKGITYTMNHTCVAMAMAADLCEGFGQMPTNPQDHYKEHQRRVQVVFNTVSHAFPQFCDDPDEENPTPADFRTEQKAALARDWAQRGPADQARRRSPTPVPKRQRHAHGAGSSGGGYAVACPSHTSDAADA